MVGNDVISRWDYLGMRVASMPDCCDGVKFNPLNECCINQEVVSNCCPSGIWNGSLSYRAWSAGFAHGSIKGQVTCRDNGVSASFSGTVDGAGFLVAYISGSTTLTLRGKVSSDFVGQTGGIFSGSVSAGAGPYTLVGVDASLNANAGADNADFTGGNVSVPFNSLGGGNKIEDLFEKPKFGFGGGLGFLGWWITSAN
jgi:hypothetical protein